MKTKQFPARRDDRCRIAPTFYFFFVKRFFFWNTSASVVEQRRHVYETIFFFVSDRGEKKSDMSSCLPDWLYKTLDTQQRDIIVTSNDRVCDTSPSGIAQMINTVVAQSISQTVSDCFQNQVAEQSIRIRCNPILPGTDAVYEENAACGSCIDSILQAQLYQMDLQRRLWSSSVPTVRMPINNFYGGILNSMGTCSSYCKACSLSNVTQSNIVQANASCISVAMNSTNISSNLSSAVQQMLLSNQDVMAATCKTIGIQDVSQVATYITSNIMVVVNSDFISRLQQELQQSQVIELYSQTSVSLNNISQSSASTVTQQFVTSAEVATNALSSATISAISAQVQQQNTLNELGDAIVDSTTSFLSAMDNAVGQIMLACIALLGVVVIAIIIYFIYSKIKSAIDEREARKTANQLTAQLNTQPLFDVAT